MNRSDTCGEAVGAAGSAGAGVPAIGALLLLQADSSTIVDRAPLLGLAVAGVGVVLAVVGALAGAVAASVFKKGPVSDFGSA